jgi:lipopolysaccharide/colanic/teichoic acid biosynthesis glycosyltransferase
LQEHLIVGTFMDIPMMMYRSFFKPFADFFAALLLLILFSPLIVLMIILLVVANKGDVFFFQQRPGFRSKPFCIIKFKTMREAWDEQGNLLPDDERLTVIGRKIRAWSLDELLQVINVLKGEMSIVGPRPLFMKYLPLYSPEQARRHDVMPGITGWAQVNGRNAITWEKRFQLDAEYVNKQSFGLDVKILWMTVWNVLSRKGISAEGHETMFEFEGND